MLTVFLFYHFGEVVDNCKQNNIFSTEIETKKYVTETILKHFHSYFIDFHFENWQEKFFQAKLIKVQSHYICYSQLQLDASNKKSRGCDTQIQGVFFNITVVHQYVVFVKRSKNICMHIKPMLKTESATRVEDLWMVNSRLNL